MVIKHREDREIGSEACVHLRLFSVPGSDSVDLVVGTGVAEVELSTMIVSAEDLTNIERLIPRLERSSRLYLSMN